MLATKYRPQTFDDVVGQEMSKKVLQKVAQKPEGKPRVFILQGTHGVGKTTLARIFGKAVNCKGGKPCSAGNLCEVCSQWLKENPCYLEYDSAQVGNVKDIKAFRESWGFAVGKSYRTVLFDECQVVSREGQSALLSITEDPPRQVFFFFCTTDVESLIRPLRSRALILDFYPLLDSEMAILISSVEKKEEKKLSLQERGVIIRRAKGHARDAVQLMEQCFLLEKEFLNGLVLADKTLIGVFRDAAQGHVEQAREGIESLMRVPLIYLNEDLEFVMKKMLDKILLEDQVLWGKIDERGFMQLFQLYVKSKFILTKSTNDFCTFMLAAIALISRVGTLPGKDLGRSRFEKGNS